MLVFRGVDLVHVAAVGFLCEGVKKNDLPQRSRNNATYQDRGIPLQIFIYTGLFLQRENLFKLIVWVHPHPVTVTTTIIFLVAEPLYSFVCHCWWVGLFVFGYVFLCHDVSLVRWKSHQRLCLIDGLDSWDNNPFLGENVALVGWAP